MCSSKLPESDRNDKDKVDDDRIADHLRDTWKMSQEALKKKLILYDTEEWQKCQKIAPPSTEIHNDSSENFQKKKSKKKHKEEISQKDHSSSSEESSNILQQMQNLHISEVKNLHLVNQENFVPPAANSILKYVAGVDISYVKDSKEKACAALVVLCLPDFQVVYEDIRLINISVPYIPGFLAFREIDFIVEMVRNLKHHSSPHFPQVILVDGNGILHPRGFGAACHLGVLLDMPTVGAAKNLYNFDGLPPPHEIKSSEVLQKVGDTLPLKTSDGEVLGVAIKTSESAKNPIYVSSGHRCSLDTAIWLIQICSQYRIPEPIRQADIRSREYLRVNAI